MHVPCSILYRLSNTKDGVKMCKTECLIYLISIRSSVSKLLEENSIKDPFSMCESCH